MAKQVLKNQISWENGIYKLSYFAEIDGIEKEIGKFVSKSLAEIIACRELLANLPTLAAKLEALENLKAWFESQIAKIDERVKTSKSKTKAKKKEKEDKDKILRDFLKKLGK